ncbi:MAG: DinB family protein [Anaerolineaceae bacterium]|nr:DinB family protein [Anaerolineaceae bacterium]
MDLQKAISQLTEQSQAILTLGAGFSLAEARWKPDPESWSVLEVLNHLVDEEVLDFRRHLDHILHTPEASWPSIDPQGWVAEKGYNQRNLEETLAQFKTERQKSLAWLGELQTPDWNSAVTMPWGSLTAGDMLASWLAHDLLHLRQLIELRYQITISRCDPYRVLYAGEW